MRAGMLGQDAIRPIAAGAATAAALIAVAYGPSLSGWAAQGPDWRLLAADPRLALRIHLGCALASLLAGSLLLSGVKGRAWHKRLGWTYVLLMAATALSSFWLRELRPGSLSWIHGLSGWVLVAAPAAVYAVKRRRLKLHRRLMTGLFWGGSVTAGGFALMPGRLLWRVLFG